MRLTKKPQFYALSQSISVFSINFSQKKKHRGKYLSHNDLYNFKKLYWFYTLIFKVIFEFGLKY